MSHPETMFVKRIIDGLEHFINVEDFDAKIHAMIDDVVKPVKKGIAALKASTAAAPAVAPQQEPGQPATPAVIPAQPAADEAPADGGSDDQSGAENDASGSGEGSEGDGTEPPPATPGAPVQRVVTKIGAKYFVTDTNGNKIVADTIEPKGYKTEVEAWTAALAVA